MRHVDTPQTRCRAGVARGDITPPVGIYHRMWGAATHEQATGVHRPLLATALWLEPLAGDAAQVVVGIDHCIIDGADMAAMRTAAAEATGLTPGQVWIALSHTHGSGWMSRSRSHLPGGDLIGPYLDGLRQTVARLAAEAKRTSRPATITYGQGRCALAAHRDYPDAATGQVVCGFNPAGPADDTVLIGRITGEDGPIGTVVNYACHPTTLAWQNTLLSPDYVGALRDVVETATGVPCLYLHGASGDLGPREGYVGDVAVADRNGRSLGYAVLSALELLPPAGTRFVYAGPVVSGATLGTWRHDPLDAASLERQAAWSARELTVDLPYRHDLPTVAETEAAHRHWSDAEAAAGDVDRARDCHAMVERMTRQLTRLRAMPAGKFYPYRVALWRLGGAWWVFAPGELYQAFQTTLRSRHPGVPIVVATVTNDWQPGYVPAASSYGYGIYQDVIAAVAPGALEVLTEAIARALRT